jgi:transposase InsO family protein
MQAVKKLIEKERKILPRLGTRKLHWLIKSSFGEHGIKCGRDKLFHFMRLNDMLIKPTRRYIQTTMSKHWMRKWPNIIKDVAISEPNQVWVSDITHIKTRQGPCYLNMITDAFSRKIVGYALENNMEAESMIAALKMANTNRDISCPIIHHSDRGTQYCSKEYVHMASKNNIRLSMTENSDPYENALAERMNRTIKEEFGMDRIMNTIDQVKQLVKESVNLYNQKRPHLALNMRTPQEVHQIKIPTT